MYRFPATKYVGINNVNQQLTHVCSEVIEIGEGLSRGDKQFDVAAEVWDAIHSLETLLRIMENAGADVSAAKMYVEGKNRARGYYGESM